MASKGLSLFSFAMRSDAARLRWTVPADAPHAVLAWVRTNLAARSDPHVPIDVVQWDPNGPDARRGDLHLECRAGNWKLHATRPIPWCFDVTQAVLRGDTAKGLEPDLFFDLRTQLVLASAAICWGVALDRRQQVLNLLINLEVSLWTEGEASKADAMASHATMAWAALALWVQFGRVEELQHAADLLKQINLSELSLSEAFDWHLLALRIQCEEATHAADAARLAAALSRSQELLAWVQFEPACTIEQQTDALWRLACQASAALARVRGDVDDWGLALDMIGQWRAHIGSDGSQGVCDELQWQALTLQIEAGEVLADTQLLSDAVMRMDRALMTSGRPDAASHAVGFSAADLQRAVLAWQLQRARALRALAQLGGDEVHRILAVQSLEQCEALLSQTQNPMAWAQVRHDWGELMVRQGVAQGNVGLIDHALEALRDALAVRQLVHEPELWIQTQHALGRALLARVRVTSEVDDAKQALEALLPALGAMAPNHEALAPALVRADVARAWFELGRIMDAEGALLRALEQGQMAWQVLKPHAELEVHAGLAQTLLEATRACAQINPTQTPWAQVCHWHALLAERAADFAPEQPIELAFVDSWVDALMRQSRQNMTSKPLREAMDLCAEWQTHPHLRTGTLHHLAGLSVEWGSTYQDRDALKQGLAHLIDLWQLDPLNGGIGSDAWFARLAWAIEAQMALAVGWKEAPDQGLHRRLKEAIDQVDRQAVPHLWARLAAAMAILDWHLAQEGSGEAAMAKATAMATLRVLGHHEPHAAARLEGWMHSVQAR